MSLDMCSCDARKPLSLGSAAALNFVDKAGRALRLVLGGGRGAGSSVSMPFASSAPLTVAGVAVDNAGSPPFHVADAVSSTADL